MAAPSDNMASPSSVVLSYLSFSDQQGDCDPTFGEQFVFDALRDELVVGEVYIRVYNDQPTFVLEVGPVAMTTACLIFNPQDAKGFATCLLDFMGTNAQVNVLVWYEQP